MNLYIICAGKIKEKWLVEGIKEYQKRLQSYVNLEIIEVADASDQEPLELAKAAESQRLLKKARDNSYKIALDLHGIPLSSEELAEKLEPWFMSGGANITLFIAGSYGFSDTLLNQVDFRLSMSKMTFTHQMSRLLIIEQIYRAFKIKRGEKYHK